MVGGRDLKFASYYSLIYGFNWLGRQQGLSDLTHPNVLTSVVSETTRLILKLKLNFYDTIIKCQIRMSHVTEVSFEPAFVTAVALLFHSHNL